MRIAMSPLPLGWIPHLLVLALLVARPSEAQIPRPAVATAAPSRPPFASVLGGAALGGGAAAGITAGVTAACVGMSEGWDEMGCVLLPLLGTVLLPVASTTGAKWAIRRSGFTPGRYVTLYSYGALLVGIVAGAVTYSAFDVNNGSREYWGTGVGFLTHVVLTSAMARSLSTDTPDAGAGNTAGAGGELLVRVNPLEKRLEMVATFGSVRDLLAAVAAPLDSGRFRMWTPKY